MFSVVQTAHLSLGKGCLKLRLCFKYWTTPCQQLSCGSSCATGSTRGSGHESSRSNGSSRCVINTVLHKSKWGIYRLRKSYLFTGWLQSGLSVELSSLPPEMLLKFLSAMLVTKGEETLCAGRKSLQKALEVSSYCGDGRMSLTMHYMWQALLINNHISCVTVKSLHGTCYRKVGVCFQLNQKDFAAFRHDIKMKIMAQTCFYNIRENRFLKKVTKTEKNFFANVVCLNLISGPAAPNLIVSLSWKFGFWCFTLSLIEQSAWCYEIYTFNCADTKRHIQFVFSF